MSSEQPSIEFRHVSITFGEKRALDDISFELGRGEMICITGVSGCGKSVLLRLASGLDVPDEGEIFVEGREIDRLDERELLAMRGASMGIVFAEQSLFSGMTVYENTAYRLDEHDWPEEDTEKAVGEILRFVGLEDDVDKLPEELSSGMRRRLEFARALIGWPKLMLFDEPTSGLDPINSRMMLDLIIRARDLHQISSLYVTKELHEIPYLAGHRADKDESGEISIRPAADGLHNGPRVMVLEEGRIAFFGTSAEFQASDLPAVNRIAHPSAGRPTTDSYIADPWSRKKKPDKE